MSTASPARRARHRGPWVIAALTLALTSLACDEDIEVGNAGPEVTVEGWCTADERTYLIVTVADLESDPVDIVACAPGGPAMGTGPTGDGLMGLSSEAEGRRHRIEWAAGGDCPCPRGADSPTVGACIDPPADGESPALELLLADPSHALESVGERTAEPLGSCP